jgi:hypothetical protein
MTRRLAKVRSWVLPVLALLMLGFTLTPAEVWSAPVNDAVYSGFDRNLIYANRGGGGAVDASASSIDLTAGPASVPSVILATTPLPKLSASVDAVVLDNTGGGEPLRIGVWSPWTGAGQFVVFGPAPENMITAETIVIGGKGPTLVSGNAISSTILGRYQLGTPYTVAIVIDKSNGQITTGVGGTDGVKAEASVDSQQLPTIFGNDQLSLTASTSGGTGSSHTVLRNYSLTLPHQRWWASKVADPKAEIILICLAVAGLLLLGISIATRLRGGFAARLAAKFRMVFAAVRLGKDRRRLQILIVGAVALYLAGNAILFPLGGHPFDMGSAKVYAYVARVYGPAQLYYVPNIVSVAKIWNGFPYIEAAFPYGPVEAYLSTAIGGLSSLLLAGGGTFSPGSLQLEYVIKAVNVLFGLGDAVLIYLILRQIRVSERRSLYAGALFLFNPAVWFSMSVWGQTHVFSLFFVLAAVLLAEKHLPLWAWLALAAACLTRPQMLVFGLLLGIVFLRKFSWRENLSAISWTVALTFLVMVPLTLATSPSLPVDITLNNFRVQEAGGNDPQLTTVSQGAYSIWPLVTYLVHGASGLQRAFTPSSALLVGDLTYQRVSQILTVAAMLLVSATLMFRKRATFESGGYLPLVTIGIASFLMLLTGVLTTHFLLALPFFLLCRRWMSTPAYFYVAAIWTVTTLVPMFGDMGILITSRDYPLLASSAITHFFVGLYSSDRFITVGVVANICAVIWLAVLAFRQAPLATPARPQST